MIDQTEHEYKAVMARCKALFTAKTNDYGASWRILRLPSITDQIMIKAQRIRSIQQKETQQVSDSVADEFIGIINYCLIALMQIKLGAPTPEEEHKPLTLEQLVSLYDSFADHTYSLLQKKNHDYDEAWRSMRVSSMTDIILMKLYRVKQIEDNAGKTSVSEGIDANYQDMINYSVFCLIKLNSKQSNHEESH